MQIFTPVLGERPQKNSVRFTLWFSVCLLFLCGAFSLGFALEVRKSPDFGAEDCPNVPGLYKTGQEVCEARRYWLDIHSSSGPYVPPLHYIPISYNNTSSEGVCQDAQGQAWSYPATGLYCLQPFQARNATRGLSSRCVGFFEGGYCARDDTQYDPPKNYGNQCASSPMLGNPIHPGIGNKYQLEVDYTSPQSFGLSLQRSYNSASNNFAAVDIGVFPSPGGFGSHWLSNWHRRIDVSTTPTLATATVTRPDGREFFFNRDSGNNWVGEADISDRLERLTDAGGNPTGWRYTTADGDQVETYDVDGKLLSIANRAGLTQTLTYNAQGHLTAVTDAFGRTLIFTYDSQYRIATMTDPAGKVYTYTYDTTTNNLTSVTYSDGKTRTYLYEDPRFQNRNALTGIMDENGQRFATYAYDDGGYAISSEHAGRANKVMLVYGGVASDGTTTTSVTDALGTTRSYGFATVQGVVKNTALNQPCTSCGSTSSAMTYDVNGNVASRTDFNGNLTTYTYDLTRNLETQRIEAAGTAQARTITTDYHSTFRLMTHVAEPLRITTYVYDDTGATCGARGALCSKTIQATTDATGAQGFNATPTGSPRAWRYTYNSNGQVLTVDGARTDVQDLTSYTYDNQGNVTSITNALGHVTTITSYNAHGQPLRTVDPNGLVTTLTYDERQRLTSRTVGTETTTYAYDGVGQLIKVTLPDGSFLTYTYDAAHRLTDIADSVADKITYQLDAMGNRIQEKVFDPSNTLTQTRKRVYDSLNRLAQDIGAQNQTTQYVYDNHGNRTSITDPLNHTTFSSFDALNRLVQMTDPNNGKIHYAYDGLDQLASVSDPRNLITQYTYTGLNDLTQTISPDTGTTQNTYDEAGNVITSTDAKGQTTRYTYDALNRVTQIAYAGGVTHTYQYDQGQNGLGRLTSITDPSGTTSYAYDLQGRVITETRVIAGITSIMRYLYNAAGQRIEMDYPSGRVLAYSYDQANRIASLTLDGQPLLSNILYQPFGAVTGWTFANGARYTRSVDLDGRTDAYSLGTDTRTLIYDPASRIVGFSYSNAAQDQTFDYDALDRLTQFIMTSTTQSYAYDAVGNRTSQTLDAQTATYQLASSSNQLLAVSGLTPKTYTYDANGSLTSDGTNQLTYDARRRLASVTTPAGTIRYSLNALGQRVGKLVPGGSGVETIFSDSFAGTNGRAIDDQPDGLWTGGSKKKTVAAVQNGQAVIAAGKELQSKATFTSQSGILTLQATLIRGEVELLKSQASNQGVTVHYNGHRQIVIHNGHVNKPADRKSYTLTQAGLPLALTISLKEGASRVTIHAGSQTLDTGDLPNTLLHLSDPYSIVLAAPGDQATGIMDDVRLTKGAPATVSTTVYAWDTQGHTIGEYDATGKALQETVYLGDIPVAVLAYQPTGAMQVFYLYTDHLNTVRVITDTSNKIVWRWDSSDPFGVSSPDEDPDGDGKPLTFNLRFPGQYFDKETGLYYNYFRNYDPRTGRYVQSDPIGLRGGINTYIYVNNKPVNNTDPSGLISITWPIDCYYFFKYRAEFGEAIRFCRKEYESCKTDRDEIEFMDKYGANYRDDAIFECAKQKSPDTWQKVLEYGTKCGISPSGPWPIRLSR